mmetsp:Transcript_97978/g.277116  ORF Transcript_97978/g.277116 Transcript_97978/m.277116 type:complete len:220 (-) Transcript_97978:571-1230(-)
MSPQPLELTDTMGASTPMKSLQRTDVIPTSASPTGRFAPITRTSTAAMAKPTLTPMALALKAWAWGTKAPRGRRLRRSQQLSAPCRQGIGTRSGRRTHLTMRMRVVRLPWNTPNAYSGCWWPNMCATASVRRSWQPPARNWWKRAFGQHHCHRSWTTSLTLTPVEPCRCTATFTSTPRRSGSVAWSTGSQRPRSVATFAAIASWACIACSTAVARLRWP